MNGHTIGVDVGGTKVAYGLFDARGALIDRSRVETAQGLPPDAFLGKVTADIRALCARNGLSAEALSGVGVGVPCFVRQPEGYLIKSSNIPTLREFPAKAFLESALGGPRVALGNDTHAAGLAESRRGAGRGHDSVLYCSVSSGISSAPIIHGRLFLGSHGFSGESGHMLITPDEGELCACGKRGCFMSWCSGHMIVRHIRRWIHEGERTAMLDLAGGDPMKITTYELKRAWEAGDALAARAVDQMQRYLSLWFFNLYVFTNIDCFVLGGGLLKMGGAFWEGAFARFRSLDDGGCPVHFRQAELGDDTGVIGANELLS